METDLRTAVAVDRVYVEVLFTGKHVTSSQISNVLDLLDTALALTSPARVYPVQFTAFGAYASAPILVDRLEFGSPFKLLGKLPGLTADSRRAALAFFKNLIFFEPEKSRRQAEAALAWEQVFAARIANMKAVAELVADEEKKQNIRMDKPDGRTDFVVSTTAALLQLSERFRHIEGQVVEFSLGDEAIRRPDADEE